MAKICRTCPQLPKSDQATSLCRRACVRTCCRNVSTSNVVMTPKLSASLLRPMRSASACSRAISSAGKPRSIVISSTYTGTFPSRPYARQSPRCRLKASQDDLGRLRHIKAATRQNVRSDASSNGLQRQHAAARTDGRQKRARVVRGQKDEGSLTAAPLSLENGVLAETWRMRSSSIATRQPPFSK